MTDSRQTQEPSTAMYRCLASARRRFTLHRLKEADKPLALADLARDVADWETETKSDERANEVVEDVHTSLYHNHVPKLADAGLVRYDHERGVVELVEYPEELEPETQFLAVR